MHVKNWYTEGGKLLSIYWVNCTNLEKKKIMYSLSDLMLKCSLLYGAEIWGFDNSSYVIERLHLFAMKKM